MASFIDLWTRREFETHQANGTELLCHVASSQLRDRGVRVGDSLFVVSCFAGRLHLLGRLDVAHLLGPVEAAAHFDDELDGYKWARDHACPADDNVGPMHFDLVVPNDV